MNDKVPRNLGVDLVRATEAAALRAGRWMGLGERDAADEAAAEAMAETFRVLEMEGYLVIGTNGELEITKPVERGYTVGIADGEEIDVVVDPVDGINTLAHGEAGAISVAAAAPANTMWAPHPAIYMDKIVVDRVVADALVPECLDAPPAWTLALVARVKQKELSDLVVFVLDRPRHEALIDEIRTAGARVMLRTDGDVAGAILAAMPHTDVDIMMGVGGIAEGVMAACAVRALHGAMLCRLVPQSERELQAVEGAGLDTKRVLTGDDVVTSEKTFFAATGITDGPLLNGVRYHGRWAETQSLLLRAETGSRRFLHAEHWIGQGGVTHHPIDVTEEN